MKLSLNPLDDIERVLIDEEAIRSKVRELGAAISRDYAGKDLTLVSILKGSVVFLADLLRNISTQCSIDFISVSSYKGEPESSGVVRMIMDLRESPVGKNILIVEDIVDTGYTLDYLCRNLLTRGLNSLAVCVLLDKTAARKKEVRVDYKGFDVPNEFLVGFGLDYKERYRNIPFVGVLKPEIYKKAK
ncbi:MAG: hypoxanthine phosphoribosyltransferase [Elusimicrobia bacterium HGW-Elusimicrobia-1]|jgi:hypoxanthine phosphoribosyltransferase|nr:MAG: hypoxanthine phosphoribosyltransferase [Elusimicrobia bacterium HGW-Elusimicrobia-1]